MKRITATVVALAAGSWLLGHVTSPRVREWHPGGGRIRPAGRLTVRVLGTGERVIVLLHGLAASQAYFGRAYDHLAKSTTVIVPDLLGFGMSDQNGQTGSQDFSVTEHCVAIGESIRALGLGERPILFVGHSMGSTLAMALAADRSFDARGVIAFGAPMYRTRDEAQQHVDNMGWFEALLSSGPRAQLVCAWMCRHRTTAALVAVVANPRLPIRVAQDGVRHSWASYINSFETVVVAQGWESSIATLASLGVPVDLVNGDSDSVPVTGRAHELQQTYSNVSSTDRRGDHDLPLAEGSWCSDFIERRLDSLIPSVNGTRTEALPR